MTFSLFNKRGILFCLTASLIAGNSFGQGTPVSQSANSMVNLNTGDFQYSLPVISVPGPNGENVPITFSYSGGIRMDEQASWIGLGWNYNPGEISHHVKGASDDSKGKGLSTTTYPVSSSSTTETTNIYGPLYFKNLNYSDADAAMDIAASTYKLSDGLFWFPDYDSYNVSGPGISGTMEPRLFDQGVFHAKDVTGNYWYSSTTDAFSKTANFVFTNELNGTITANTTNYGFNGDYNSTANRAHTASYIEYFTNANINSGVSGFWDYRIISGTRRPTSDFDADDIGAFRITTPDGMIYHYSLPVYMLANEESVTFFQNSTFGVDGTKELKKVKRSGKYVLSWKLTAITGPDFSDANSNGIVDIGDTGYWIAFNYGKWTDNFQWKSPFFNYRPNQYSKSVKDNPQYTRSLYTTENKDQGTVSRGETQSYYLNNIQTATHTAFFIKDVRADAHSVNSRPALKLNKIVLVKNENIPLFSNSGSLSYNSGFNLTDCSPSEVTPHIGNYNANELVIKNNSLTTVELVTDYSLCKLVYNNINNISSFGSSTVQWNGFSNVSVYESAGNSTATANNNSGKLTLNEVKVYGTGYKAAAPSYLFDYDQSNSTKNPNFSNDNIDYWGYYKSDYNIDTRCRYTSNTSAGNVDAWSLKKITTPLGGEILIEYESDYYNYTCTNNRSYTQPVRYFLIKNASYSSTWPRWTLTMIKDIHDFLNADSITKKAFTLPYLPSAGCTDLVAYGSDPAPIGNNALFLTEGGSTSSIQYLGIDNDYLIRYSNSTEASCPAFGTPITYDVNRARGQGYVTLTFSRVPGGGTRVKQITVKDTESNQSYINEYSYIRGIAGSEPIDVLVTTDNGTVEKNKNASDPFIPGAYVTYTGVNVKSKSLNNTYNGRTKYDYYSTFEPYQIYKSPNSGSSTITSNYVATKTTGILNSPKSVTVYDQNDNIISRTTYEYNTIFENSISPQVTEKFRQYFNIKGVVTDPIIQGTHSKVERKARLISKTTYASGITTKEDYLKWDAVSGQVTKSRIINPTDGVTEIYVDPAFRETAYSAMRAKSIDDTCKNILTATYKTTIRKDRLVRNVYNELVPSQMSSTTAGTKTTWRQSYPKRVYDNATSKYITQSTSSTNWKSYKNYSFNGNTNDAYWKDEGEVTIYDKRNNPLEAKNGNNRYSASKLGYDQKFTLCQASDSKYADFAFSSFEDKETVATGIVHFGGEITHGEMQYAGDGSLKPHTGNFMVKVDPGYGPGNFAKGFTTGRSYRASVWIHKNSPSTAALVVTLDGSITSGTYQVTKTVAKSDASNITIGDWILMTTTIDVPSDFTETGGSLNDLRVYCNNPGSTPAYFDDLSIRPVDIEFTGNVIDEKTGRTLAVLDKNDLAVKYVYDDAGRVREIWEESPANGWKLKTRYSYNFKRTY